MKSHFLPLRFRSILNSRIGFCINSIKFLTSKFLDCKTENTFKLFVHETFLVRKWREICLEFFFSVLNCFSVFYSGSKGILFVLDAFLFDFVRLYSHTGQNPTEMNDENQNNFNGRTDGAARKGRTNTRKEQNRAREQNTQFFLQRCECEHACAKALHMFCIFSRYAAFELVFLPSRLLCILCTRLHRVFNAFTFHFFRLSLSLSCCTILHSGRCRRQAIVSAFLISVFIRFLSVSLCLRAMESAWHAIVRQSRHREAAALTRKKRFLKRQKKKGKILNGVALRRPLELFNGNHILCSLRVLIHSCRLFHTFSPSIFLCDIVPSCFPWSLAEQTNCVVLTRLFIATFENWPLFQWRAVNEAKGNASRSVVLMFFSVSRYQHETIADILAVVVRSLL